MSVQGDNAKKKGFLVYYDNEIIISRLSDDEVGKLFKSLFPYAQSHIKPDFEYSPALATAFDVLSMAIDRDAEKYNERCEKNRNNIRKRWNTNNTSEYDRNKSYTKHTDRDMDKDMDMDMDKDKDRDKDRVNYQQIADMYNEICISFPRVTKLSDARKRAIGARMKKYSIDDFKRLFQLAQESSFLKGQNDRNWSANFDWLLKDANMAKVLDGNYSERKSNRKPGTENNDPDYDAAAWQRAREQEKVYAKILEGIELDPELFPNG